MFFAFLLHLQHCDQCNGNASNCKTIGSDGPGVNSADYILYVGANPASSCASGAVLAIANLCQMESTLDRLGPVVLLEFSIVVTVEVMPVW